MIEKEGAQHEALNIESRKNQSRACNMRVLRAA